MNSTREMWKKFFNKKAESDNMFVQMGRSSYRLQDFFLMLNDITNALSFNREDIVLDAGGGVGWTSIYLSPFVKEITLFDFAENMVTRGKEITKPFGNIRVVQDDLMVMANVHDRSYDKIIVGGVLNYLGNYDQVKKCFFNIFSVMKPKGMTIFTHNPDIKKRSQHIDSYKNLSWEPKKINQGLEMEEKRLWFDFDVIKRISSEIGFARCYEIPINPKLWQSTHMFDFMVEK